MGTAESQEGSAAACARCGESLAPGSPLYSDHVRSADGKLRCAECARVERGVAGRDAEPEVPITQPNPNLPNTH